VNDAKNYKAVFNRLLDKNLPHKMKRKKLPVILELKRRFLARAWSYQQKFSDLRNFQ
jgi:hypothetical protein